MKFIKTILICIAVLGLASCGSKTQESAMIPSTGIITETCEGIPDHSYEVFVPKHSESEFLPAMIILDPHGDGRSAIQRFVDTTSRCKMIFVASNLIENNFVGFESAISNLIQDVGSKYPLNKKQVFLAGFSGGARMALAYASRHPAHGVLACGAFINPLQANQLKCPVYGLVGKSDFNLMEYGSAIIASNPDGHPNVAMQLFSGGHEWPKHEDLNNAIGFFLHQRGLSNQNQRKQYLEQELEEANKLLTSGAALDASLVLRNLQVVFSDGDNYDKLKKQLTEIYKTEPYKAEKKKWITSLQKEGKMRKYYMQQLDTNPIAWWENEKAGMENKIADPSHPDKEQEERIKAFMGILLFSQVRSNLEQQNWEHANHLLKVYRLFEPENPDAWYYTALYYLKTGNPEKAKEYLRKAESYGFSDTKRTEQDFGGSF